MQNHHIWLIAGIVLCTLEMLTGTFFMLVLGVAALVGALIAWGGYAFWLQAIATSAVGVIGVGWVQLRRNKAPIKPVLSLDVGQPVTFERWISQPEGMGRVYYRGSTWDAHIAPCDAVPGAILYIQAVNNNVLEVSKQSLKNEAPKEASCS